MFPAFALCPGYCRTRRPRAASSRGTLLGGLLLLALASPAWAQRGQPQPAPRKAAAAPADTTHQLSMRKTEEALRLLLRADSVQQARVQPGMEAEAEGFVLDRKSVV